MWCPVAEITWDFDLTDFHNRMRFATRIWKRNDLVSKYLWDSFSDYTKKLFGELDGPLASIVENPLIDALIVELNRALERSDLYDPKRFADVRARREITNLLEEPLKADDQLLFNRMLLESAYPDDIVRSGKIEGLAAEVVHFFAHEHLIIDAEGRQSPPKTLHDFLNACPSYHYEEYPDLGFEIRKLCHNLIGEGLLYPAGFDPTQRLPLNERFFSDHLIRDLAVYGSYDFAAFGFPKIRKHFAGSVVKLSALLNGKEGRGTGFLLGDSQIVTAGHCLPSGALITIDGWDLNKAPVSRIVTFQSPSQEQEQGGVDIAILEFESDPFPHLPKFKLWGDAVLEDILAMGYPPLKGFKSGLIASKGEIISREFAEKRQAEMIIFSASVKPGNSGGPLINRYGKVVGIVTNLLRYEDQDIAKLGYGLAFPAQLILDLINVARGRKVDGRPFFLREFTTQGNAIKMVSSNK